MSEFTLNICCMGAGYVGGPTMAVIALKCPQVRNIYRVMCVKHLMQFQNICCYDILI